jgi:hypothetical protein
VDSGVNHTTNVEEARLFFCQPALAPAPAHQQHQEQKRSGFFPSSHPPCPISPSRAIALPAQDSFQHLWNRLGRFPPVGQDLATCRLVSARPRGTISLDEREGRNLRLYQRGHGAVGRAFSDRDVGWGLLRAQKQPHE